MTKHRPKYSQLAAFARIRAWYYNGGSLSRENAVTVRWGKTIDFITIYSKN